MMKIAEKLIILKEAGEGLLQRIASAKRILSSPTLRPAFLSDQQYSRVTQALLKKFPEFEPNVDKTPGYDTLTGKAKGFFDDLEPLYFSFVDAFEFKEAAVQTLCEIASSIVEMKVEDNPLVTVNFLDLFAIATQLNFLISFIEERKIILAVYYKLFFFIKCTNEPNFARVAKYAVALDDPIKVMQDEYRPLNSSLGKTLINLLPLYTKLKTVTLLRKEGTLNLTLKPEDMSKPVVDKFHYQLVNSNNMYLWIIFGFLMCPETLALPGAIDLCKLALTDGFVVPIFRNSTIQLHVEYDNLFSNYKSKTVNLSKHKKLVKDVIPESVQKGALSHKQRRVYLRQELSALCNLFADKPGLLGPKIQIAIGALSLAKEEVFWYFRHFKAPAPKGYSKKITEDEMKDNRISEILFLMDKLTSLIKQHKRIIQQYYLEYLKGADKKKITEVCDAAFYSTVGTGISQIAKSIIDEVSSINVDAFVRGNKQYDFKALRLNWFRAEAFFSSVQSSVPLIKIKHAVDRFTLIYNHTRFVDDLDALLDQHASLKQLWYFKDIFVESFSRSIKDGPNQPLHCLTYLNLLSEFTNNSTQYNPEERAEIGVQVVQQAEKFLDELAARTVALINEVAKQYILFDSGLADVNAAYPLLMKRKDYKPPKDFNPPVPPGMESNYRSRGHLDRLRLYERNCWQLCAALHETETITVFDHVFAPREYLREKLIESFRSFVRSASAIEIYDDKHRLIEKQIQRPSVVEKQLETYVASLKLLENYVDFDLGEMMREVIIGEIWIPALGKAGTLDFASAEETDIKFNGSMVGNFVTWYGEFISKKASSPQSGIIFSQARKGFVSKLGMPLRAELYTDIVELKSLCNLIGPYGVKLIDREILKFVLSSVNTLKDYVSHNRQALDELRVNYHNENACNESLKKIKDADNFIARSIGIGNALNFRELLHEALRYVMEEKTPFLFSSIHNSFNQYRRNTFMSPELLGIDLLALESGIEIGTADQAMKKFLSKAIGSADAPLWDLLPFMYAASFNSAIWKDAQYNPVLEGHNNNAHSLAKCISSLIVAFKAITNSNADEKEIVVLLQKFVTASSVLLLRIARGSGNKQDKHTPVDVPSMIVFMDKFIQECPLLSREALEAVLPYALLRNEWKNIFSTKVPSTQSKKELTAE